MAKINSNYGHLAANYLFPEISGRVAAYQAQHPSVRILRLGIGDTTEPLTAAVLDGIRTRVDQLSSRDTYRGYGDSEGELALRRAIVDSYAERGASIEPDEVFVSDGAKPDSGNIQSIFSPDAIVAVQDPAYPVYVDTNVIAGRAGRFDPATGGHDRIVYMPCTEENLFFPAIPKQKVDLVYLCSPNNPTGMAASREQLEGFVHYARQERAVIIYDAAYAAFIRDPALPRSIFEIEGARECAIEIQSLSKSAGFTGVRLGWSVVPKSLVVEDGGPGALRRLWSRRQNTFFNGASNLAQAGARAALGPEGRAESRKVVDYYLDNAALVRRTLAEMGMVCFGGLNAPYVWARVPRTMKSWDFFDLLLEQAHVVGTPGSGFGPSGEGYFRLSAFGHREDIQLAVDSIRTNLKLG